MIYYHPAMPSIHEDHIVEGFLSFASLRNARRHSGWYPGGTNTGTRSFDKNADTWTLAFDSPGSALEYARGAFSESINWVVLVIEGEFETRPITGSKVPANTVQLKGEISPDQVRLYEEAPVPSI